MRLKFLSVLAAVLACFGGEVVAAELAPKTVAGAGHLSGILGNEVKACEVSCTTQEECIREDCLGQFGVCEGEEGSKECACDSTVSVPSSDGLRCLATGVVKIGESCEKEEQCVGKPGESSTCTKMGVCGCMPGYPPSMNFDDCLEIQNELGKPCNESHQCTMGTPGRLSECADGKCNCNSESVSEGDGDICYLTATLVGQQCEVDSQCTKNLLLSHCFNKTSCRCYANATPNRNNTRCQLNINLGDTCVANEACDHIPSAVCSSDKKCECDEGYGRNPKLSNDCMKWATKIGDYCDKDASQCKNLDNVTCILLNVYTYHCGCTSAQVESEDGTACLPGLLKLNESCIENAQCNVSSSACLNSTDGSNRCSCVSGYVEGVKFPNLCFQIRSEMGGSCTEDVQCRTIGSPPGTVPCHFGYCYCDYTSQVTSQDGKRCLPIRNNLNETCTESIQCQMTSGGVCSKFADGIYRCTCSAGYVDDGFRCGWVSNNSAGKYSQVNKIYVVIMITLVSSLTKFII